MLEQLQFFLFSVSTVYWYVLAPLSVFYMTIMIIREIKKKN
jgi:hypothetical protein